MAVGTGVLWKGKYYVLPQASSSIDSSALSPVQFGATNRLVLMGEMTGLIPPKTLQKIDSSMASSLLAPESEEARLAANLVFAPGNGVAGASDVWLLPVNPATQATITLSSVITLDTYLYGQIANQVKVAVAAGTTTGKKVTVTFQDTVNPEIHDNIAKPSFSIQYTGSGSACTVTVNVAAATKKLTTSVTGASENLDLSFDTYPTVKSLVDAINAYNVAGVSKYTATMITTSPLIDTTLLLDNATAVACRASAATISADLQAMIDRINERSAYVSATRVADAGAAPANVGSTFLAGASDGVTANSDWQTAFDVLKSVEMDLIVPLTSSVSIHEYARAHCVEMSGPTMKAERRTFVGGALLSWAAENSRTSNTSTLKAAVVAINSDRVIHVGLGSKHYDANGDLKLYPAYVTAAMYAGMAAGASPTMPLTRKYLACKGLEVELRKTEIDELLEGHVAVPIPDLVQHAGYVISRQLTTWAGDADLYRVEFSVGRGADYIAKEVRNRHELIVGQPATAGMDTTIVNLTNSVLESALNNDLIAAYDPTATVLRSDGVIRYIDYSAKPVLPINWLFSTYHLVPTKFSLSL